MVCFHCGRIGHPKDDCKEVVDLPSSGLIMENVMEDQMETQPSPAKGGVNKAAVPDGGDEVREQQPRLGPWVVTSSVWPPRTSVPARGKKGARVQLESIIVSLERPRSMGKPASPPCSPPNADSEQKPAKVAYRRSPDLVWGHQESPNSGMMSPIPSESLLPGGGPGIGASPNGLVYDGVWVAPNSPKASL